MQEIQETDPKKIVSMVLYDNHIKGLLSAKFNLINISFPACYVHDNTVEIIYDEKTKMMLDKFDEMIELRTLQILSFYKD